MGQRIPPVGLGAVLADQDLRPEPRQQRRDDRVEGAQPTTPRAWNQPDYVHRSGGRLCNLANNAIYLHGLARSSPRLP